MILNIKDKYVYTSKSIYQNDYFYNATFYKNKNPKQ